MANKWYVTLFALILITAATVYCVYPYFSCNQKYADVNIAEGLIIITTIFSAYWVSTVLSNNSQHVRYQKEILIRELDESSLFLEKLAPEIQKNDINFFYVSSIPKRVRMKIKTVYQLLDKCKISAEKNIKREIYALLEDLNKLLTETPIVKSSVKTNESAEITIKENTISYNENRKRKIELKIDKIKTQVVLLKFEIIKA